MKSRLQLFYDGKETSFFAPKKGIEKLVGIFKQTFAYKSNSKIHSLLRKGHHSKIESINSNLLLESCSRIFHLFN